MNTVCLSSKEVSEALILSAQNKVSMSTQKRLLMSIMAGLYIALGAQGFIVMYENMFIRASVFPVGLMLIVLVGGELYTGNCLMTLAVLQKKIKTVDYIKCLFQVLIGNFIGAQIAVAFLYYGGLYKSQTIIETIARIADSKLSLTFSEALIRGILCNILVSLAVWLATTAKDTTGKFLGCWFPIMLFAITGYEHVVANMFYLPIAVIFNQSITIWQIVIRNFIPVTIGNYIGGGILVPVVYYKVYHK